jgi:hypothetical protein
MDLKKSSFLDFFSYLLPNQLYHKDKTVSVSIMEQPNPGKQYLVQLIEHPIFRFPSFNFPNLGVANWFLLSHLVSCIGIFGCIFYINLKLLFGN